MNLPLQARAGRNSPKQCVAPEFTALQAGFKRLQAVAAPGVDLLLATGRKGLLSSGLDFFIGANVGGASIDISAYLKDPLGNTVEVQNTTLSGINNSVSLAPLNILPEGYEQWLNLTLTAGTYGNDASVSYGHLESLSQNFEPVDLETSLKEVFSELEQGHTLYALEYVCMLYNSDNVNHDVELYVDDGSGNVLVRFDTVLAGKAVSFGPPAMLDKSLKVQMRITSAINTPGKTVTFLTAPQISNAPAL